MKETVTVYHMYLFNAREEIILHRLNELRLLSIYKIEKCYLELSNYPIAVRYTCRIPRILLTLVNFYFDHYKKDEKTEFRIKRFFSMSEEKRESLRRETFYDILEDFEEDNIES